MAKARNYKFLFFAIIVVLCSVKLFTQLTKSDEKGMGQPLTLGRFNDVKGIGQPSTPGRLNKHKDFYTTLYNVKTSDIVITVKTSGKFHQKRIRLILETWYNWVQNEMYVITDKDDNKLKLLLADKLIVTDCIENHSRKALCCKTRAEFNVFLKSGKLWWCHMDDDTYLNVPELLQILRKYNYNTSVILGKPVLDHPERRQVNNTKAVFWFPTGGAGYCISKALAKRMKPFMNSAEHFETDICEKISINDDAAIGYVTGYILGTNLTIIKSFHSHLERLWFIGKTSVQKEVTLSYSFHPNVVGIHNIFKNDTTRFYSIYCLQNKKDKKCQNITK